MNNTQCLHQNKLDAVMESRDAPCIETCFFMSRSWLRLETIRAYRVSCLRSVLNFHMSSWLTQSHDCVQLLQHLLPVERAFGHSWFFVSPHRAWISDNLL